MAHIHAHVAPPNASGPPGSSASHARPGCPAGYDRAFAVGIGLNVALVLLQAGFGLAAGSMALVADAGHNLSDVLGLVLAWAATWLCSRAPTSRRTYGLGRSSILASLANSLVLLLAVGAIGLESIQRLWHPEPVATATVMAVAGVGIVINGATAAMFLAGRKHDLNIRSAFLHMAADAGVSLGVVASALAIRWTGWLWLDPLVSLVIVGVIVASTWGLLRESLDLALDAVPATVDRAAVEGFLAAVPGVAGVHDLHIWGLSTTRIALTAHLVIPDPAIPADDAFLLDLDAQLRDRFGIAHATIQVERCPDNACLLAAHDTV
jgi:cobalt-zinc-cadmium efflux system protein